MTAELPGQDFSVKKILRILGGGGDIYICSISFGGGGNFLKEPQNIILHIFFFGGVIFGDNLLHP